MSGQVRDRRAERNQLWLVGALPSLVLLVIAGLLVLLVWSNSRAMSAYDDGDHGAAYDRFAGLRDFGRVEPWIAPFNAGTAAFRDGEFETAVSRLSEALRDVPTARECDVRTNLALAHEAIADAAHSAGSTAAALKSLRDGRAAVVTAGCSPEVAARLDQKIRDLSTSTQQQPDQQLTPEQKEAELQERNDKARRQRQKEEQKDPPEEPDQQINW